MFVRGRIRIDRWEPERVSRTYEAERLWIRALRWIIKFNIREGCWIIIRFSPWRKKFGPPFENFRESCILHRFSSRFSSLDSKSAERDEISVCLIISHKFCLCVLHRRSANLDGEFIEWKDMVWSLRDFVGEMFRWFVWLLFRGFVLLKLWSERVGFFRG